MIATKPDPSIVAFQGNVTPKMHNKERSRKGKGSVVGFAVGYKISETYVTMLTNNCYPKGNFYDSCRQL